MSGGLRDDQCVEVSVCECDEAGAAERGLGGEYFADAELEQSAAAEEV